MRTLVFGGTGIVGSALVREGRGRGWPVLGLSHGQGEITDQRRVDEICAAFRPDLIVNCAAFTKVDLCESEPAQRLRGQWSGGRRTSCARRQAAGARLVHLSTDYVFDGRATSPYREDHPTAPQSSLRREQARRGSGRRSPSGRALVVRTSWVFGAGGANFVDTIAGRIRGGQKSFRVVAGPAGRPYLGPLSGQSPSGSGRMGRQRADALSESADGLLVRIRAGDRRAAGPGGRDHADSDLGGAASGASAGLLGAGGRSIRETRGALASSPGRTDLRATSGQRQRSS